MKISTDKKPAAQVPADALIIPVFEDAKETRFGAADLAESGEIAGKSLELTLLHHVPGVAATRVLLAGAGKAEKFTSAELRKLVAAAVRFLRGEVGKKGGLRAGCRPCGAGFRVRRGGRRHPWKLRTGPVEDCRSDKKSLEEFTVVGSGEELETAAGRGQILAEAQNFTRDLVNEPANLLPPSKLAAAARQMAEAVPVSSAKCWNRARCRNWAWGLCWAWRRAARNRRR